MIPVYNFWVEKNNQNVWTGVRSWYLMGKGLTLIPGQLIEFPEHEPAFLWNMKDNTDNLVSTGIYDVIGGLDHGHEYSIVSVPIEIIPEPITLLIICTGIPLLRKRFKP